MFGLFTPEQLDVIRALVREELAALSRTGDEPKPGGVHQNVSDEPAKGVTTTVNANTKRLASLAREIGAYVQALSEQEVPYDLAVQLAHDYHTAAIANWLGVSIVPAGTAISPPSPPSL